MRRKRGVVPSNAISVGDAVRWVRLAKTKWANPFKIDKPGKLRDGTRAEVIAKHRAWIMKQPELMAALPELRGKDLACWCAPLPCHADVLLKLANRTLAAATTRR